MAAPIAMAALASAGKTAGVILRSPWFWIAIVILILFLIGRKYWHRIAPFFQSSDIELEPGEPVKPPPAKEAEIKGLASQLYSDIYDTPITGHTTSLYIDANNLTDTQLKVLSKYYRKQLTQGTYLYTDVDDEVFAFWTSVDSVLMAHLAKVGEKGA